MRVNAINPVTFRGIRVNKKQEEKTQQVRPQQKEVLDTWNDYLRLLASGQKSEENRTADELAETLDVSPKESYAKSGLFSDAKEPFYEYKGVLDTTAPKLVRTRTFSDSMLDVSNSSIQKIRDIDKREIYGFDANGIFAIKSNVRGIDSVAGYTYETSVLNSEFIQKVKDERAGKDSDIVGSILFFGPYSNGKTYITKAVAAESGCNIAKVKIANDSEEEAEKAMQKIYEYAYDSESKFPETRQRTIIFIDEVDKMLGQNESVTKQFSEFIKNCSQAYHCSVFAATNNPLDLGLDYKDEDVFPIKMSIDLPEGENTKAMFRYYLSKYPTVGVDFDALIEHIQTREKALEARYSNGQIKHICNEAWYQNNGKPIEQDKLTEIIDAVEPEISKELENKFLSDYKALIKS